MIFDHVSNENYMMFAVKHYNSPTCADETEFLQDLSRIRSIGRSFSRYRKTGDINERLVLNHIIVLFNVFESKAVIMMMAFKLYDYLEYIKPFLILTSRWPERITGVTPDPIIGTDVSMDECLVERLRNI